MIALEQKIWKWRDAASADETASVEACDDWIAREITLTVVVNGHELVSFSSSPVHCEDLAIGFLFTEGVIASRKDIARTHHDIATDRIEVDLIDEKEFQPENWTRTRTLTSGCGQGVQLNAQVDRVTPAPIADQIIVDPAYFHRLFTNLREFSVWYERTGCIHLAVLVQIDGSPIIREDIGRHNAVDKVIGAGLFSGINFSRSILGSSGRLSSDMLQKAARAGIPIVVSRSAPTSVAISIAEDAGITLIGFARGHRLNIYSHPQRLKFES
jgi:FdhD protein